MPSLHGEERTRESIEKLKQAILDYRRGDLEGSRFHLQIAWDRDPGAMESSPDYHRLLALQNLASGKREEGLREMDRAISLRREPFLEYYYGLQMLQLRSYGPALDHLLSAAQSPVSPEESEVPPGNSANSQQDEGKIAPDPLTLLPVSCSPRGESEWIVRRQEDPFRDPALFPAIWVRRLTQPEREYAAYQAGILKILSGQSRRNAPDKAQTDGPVKEDSGAPGAFAALIPLFQNPYRKELHGECIRRLLLERRSSQNDNDSSRKIASLKVLEETMALMLWNRAVLFDDPGSHFAFGAFLQEAGRSRESLYHLRRALHQYGLSRLASRTPPERPELASMDQTLRRMDSVYLALDMKSDARSISRLAAIIEEYLAANPDNPGVSGTASAKDREQAFRRRILDRCSENLSNRESLVVLVGSGEEDTEGRSPSLYRKRLRERDHKRDMEELFSLFGSPDADNIPAEGSSGH